jgi:hypothetical protein
LFSDYPRTLDIQRCGGTAKMEFLLSAMNFFYECCSAPEQSFALRMLDRALAQVKEMRRGGITCVIKTNPLTSQRKEACRRVFIICGTVSQPFDAHYRLGQTFAPVLSIFADAIASADTAPVIFCSSLRILENATK